MSETLPSQRTSPHFKVSKRDKFFCILFLLFWIIPILYTGATTKPCPLMPDSLAQLQRISYLFPNAVWRWRAFYLQGLPEGSETWIDITESDFFQQRPFGFRTRLHEYFRKTYNPSTKERIENYKQYRWRIGQSLADWLADQYTQKYPDKPKLVAIRFLMYPIKIEKKPYKGHWVKPEINDLRKKNIDLFRHLRTYYIKEYTHP